MAWKTITIEIGKDLGIDEGPYAKTWAKVIPIAWLPTRQARALMQSMQELSRLQFEIPEGDVTNMDPELMDKMTELSIKQMEDMLPVIVDSWYMLDEDGVEMPSPKQLLAQSSIGKIRDVPQPVLSHIIQVAMEDGTSDIPLTSKRPSDDMSSEQGKSTEPPSELQPSQPSPLEAIQIGNESPKSNLISLENARESSPSPSPIG